MHRINHVPNKNTRPFIERVIRLVYNIYIYIYIYIYRSLPPSPSLSISLYLSIYLPISLPFSFSWMREYTICHLKTMALSLATGKLAIIVSVYIPTLTNPLDTVNMFYEDFHVVLNALPLSSLLTFRYHYSSAFRNAVTAYSFSRPVLDTTFYSPSPSSALQP